MRPGAVVGLTAVLLACGREPRLDPAADVLASRAAEALVDSALAHDDVPGYLTHVRDAWTLRPHHPTLLYHLARAYALNDSVPAALEALRRLAAMGVAVRPQRDSGFAALTARPEFASLVAQFTLNADPRGASEEAFSLPDSAFLPEGVTRDPRSNTFYLGSVHQRRLVRVRDAIASGFGPATGLWSVMGMAVDTARGRRWAATSAVPEGAGTDSAEVGRAAVMAFDLATGAVELTAPSPDDGAPHWFGDLTLAPDGTVYVTDSRTPALYRLPPGAASLAPVRLDVGLLSPQGLTVTDDGATLYLADYAIGLLRVDLATGATRALPYPPDATLLGVDGLYYHGADLIAIQNGVRPHRVVRARLNDTGTAIERVEVLQVAHPMFAEPTLGVIVGDTLFYVANSEWGRFGNGAPGTDATPPHILRLTLDR